MGDLLDSYVIGSSWDEMFAGRDEPRPPYMALYQVLQALSSDDLDSRSIARDRSFRDQGITFSLSGEERPFPLDLMPRIISAEEWSTIEAGVVQRVRALEQFLADVYGPGGDPRRRHRSAEALSRPRLISTEPPRGSSRRTAPGFTLPVWISCVTVTEVSRP